MDVFLFLAGQRVPAEKTSKLGPNESRARRMKIMEGFFIYIVLVIEYCAGKW